MVAMIIDVQEQQLSLSWQHTVMGGLRVGDTKQDNDVS